MSNTSQPTTLPARSLQEMLRNMIEMDRRLSDLDTAREAAASATPDLPTFVEQHLHQLWQLSLQRTSLRSRADTITEESLETLTLLGYTDEAIRLAWLRSSADAQAYGLHTIGSYLLLRKPDDPQALELLQHVAALSLQEWGHMLIRTYINAGHLDRARAIADAMISLDTHSWALRNIAIALAEQHQWAEAQAITQTIEDLSDQDDARASLVEALIGQQQWKAARTAAEAFNNPERSYWAHIKHMEGLYKAGNPDQAQPLFESGLREALTQPNSDQRDHLLQMLAQSLTNAEQFDHAEIVVYHIHQFWPQANTRAALILALAQCGKLQAAQRLIGTACVAAEQFDNHWNSMQMLIRLTKQLSEAGITSIIDLLFDAARKAISRLENTNSSVNALCELGKALAHGQRWDAARTILSSFENQIVRDNLREALAISLIKAHQWDAAAATIAEIDELRIGSEMLRILGVALNAAGRHETALQAFTAAYSDIKLIVDRKQQTDALDRLAADVAHVGIRAYAEHILSSAITVAEVIENTGARDSAQAALVGTYIAQQRWDEALTVAQGIEDASQRDRSYLNIAQQLIEAQRWDQVYVVATAIGYDQGRIDLVCALAQLQQWEAANTIIELLKSSWARGEALLQVGSQLAAAGLHAEAQQSFDAARSSLKIAAGSQLTRWHALAAALLRAEKTDEAHQVFNLAHKIAEAAPDPITREWNLVHHVKALINSGLWDEARAIAQTIADPDKQAQIRAACALVLVNEQRWDEAHTLLIGQDHPISLSHTLLQIGALHQQAGHTAEAERFFITAHAAAGLIEREEDRDDALRDLISALIKDGRWDEAMYIADDVTDSGKRVMARAEVARGLAQNQSWHEARMLIDTLEESYARAWALEGYASALAAAGRWEELRALTAEALLAAETREDTLRLIVLPLAFAPLDPELPSRLHAALLEVEDQRS